MDGADTASARIAIVGAIRTAAVRRTRGPGSLVGQRQERLAFGAAEWVSRLFAKKKDDECKDQAEADGKREWNDGHDGI
jgi:hypothetical protein